MQKKLALGCVNSPMPSDGLKIQDSRNQRHSRPIIQPTRLLFSRGYRASTRWREGRCLQLRSDALGDGLGRSPIRRDGVARRLRINLQGRSPCISTRLRRPPARHLRPDGALLVAPPLCPARLRPTHGRACRDPGRSRPEVGALAPSPPAAADPARDPPDADWQSGGEEIVGVSDGVQCYEGGLGGAALEVAEAARRARGGGRGHKRQPLVARHEKGDPRAADGFWVGATGERLWLFLFLAGAP